MPQFAYGTRHHHAQRADIAASATFAGGIDKLNIFGLVDEKVKTLHLVVDPCCYHGVGQLQCQLVVQLF